MRGVDHEVVDAVLDEWPRVARVEQTPGVGLVLGKEQARRALGTQRSPAALGMLQIDRRATALHLAQLWPRAAWRPRPRVAKPDGGQHVQRRRDIRAVDCRDANENVFR